MGPSRRRLRLFLLAVLPAVLGACATAGPPTTGPISPGTGDAPREVIIVAHDYRFDPAPVDVVPGETVLFHVPNGGLEVHEAVIGDAAVQDAWETAEAATISAPPGPTPVVSVPPGTDGLRVVVRSGERVDVRWTAPTVPTALIVGCHIPGHWARGMQASIRFVDPVGGSGRRIGSLEPAGPLDRAGGVRPAGRSGASR